MSVAQIGALISFTDATTIEAADFNSNYTDVRNAFNNLVTGSNRLAGGISINGALTVISGGVTVTAGGLTVASGGLTVSLGNLAVTAGDITMAAAASQLVPGATSFSLRNTADSADNLIIVDAGAATFRSSASFSGDVTVGYNDTASILIQGTNGAIAAGEVGIFEAANHLSISAEGGVRVLLDNNADSVTEDFAIYTDVTAATGTPLFKVEESGFVGINSASHAQITKGLSIDQDGADNIVLAFKSSDVVTVLTTAVTGPVETDDFATFLKTSAASGGLRVQSLAMDEAVSPVTVIESYGGTATTAKSSSGRSLVEVDVYEHDGANALADITADGNVFGVRGRVSGTTRTLLMVDEDGDLFADGGTTTTAVTVFDDHNDAQLIRAFDLARNAKGLIHSEWDRHVKYNEQELVDCGVLGAPIAEGGLVCVTQLQRLHNGAIWQAYVERQELAERVKDLEQKLLAV